MGGWVWRKVVGVRRGVFMVEEVDGVFESMDMRIVRRKEGFEVLKLVFEGGEEVLIVRE